MCDEDWSLSDCTDVASARAATLVDLALNYEHVKDKAVRQKLLTAMDLLNEGIEQVVRPHKKAKPATLLPIKGGLGDPDD